MGLTLLFSALMVPTWLGALAALPPETARWAIGVGIAYTLAYLLAVALRRFWVVPLALGGALVVIMGLANSWVMMFALCVVAVSVRPKAAAVVVGGALAGLAVAAVAAGEFGAQMGNLVILGSVVAATALLARLSEANEELRRARDRVAVLAVNEERARVARDLHDILGHSLTTITLKAGLVRRLIETADERAGQEAADVERLSRQALADVRATVSGYRVVTLSGELAGAREALRAAGLTASLPSAVDDVHPDLHEVFGHVVREAVTNVIRHSTADHVTVDLGERWVTVHDDGRPAAATWGNGLTGLHERLTALGGALKTETRSGFLVRAEVP
ncbi:sensor histidine kinase [Herbidospora cretacea]|uniref:sensor histidine kinase n=1 Tax=Herbidospora cretacea TaxID=28444 RepID=UPI000A9AC161|nr:histidine kinase [Herbidospora cretacea]